MTPFGRALAGGAGLAAAFAVGALAARRAWDRERVELVDEIIDLRVALREATDRARWLAVQLVEAEEELAAYREAFPMAALSIDRQRSVN